MATGQAEAKALKKLGLPTFEEFVKKMPDELRAEEDDVQRATYNKHIESEKERIAAEAEDAKVDNAKGENGLSYPMSPKKDPRAKHLRGKWRDQGRVKCCHSRCYYPLNIALRPESGMQREGIEIPDGHDNEGEKAYRAICSWDPRHKRMEDGSDQYILHNQLFPPEDPGDADLES